jgi:protein-serine/threonine kinase
MGGSERYGTIGPSAASINAVDAQSASQVQVFVTPTPSEQHHQAQPRESTPERVQRTPSIATDGSLAPVSLASRVRRSVGLYPSASSDRERKGLLRIHHGAVDTNTVTTRPPLEVMNHVRSVLVEMGVEITHSSDYKFRCVRPKRRKAGIVVGGGIGMLGGVGANGVAGTPTPVTVAGSASSNGVGCPFFFFFFFFSFCEAVTAC